MKHEQGIETAQVFLSKTLFDRALRAANEEQERELKRILAGQYRGEVKPDPFDVISIDWKKAPPELQKTTRQDISVVATIEIARGHRVLADFVREHREHTEDYDETDLFKAGAFVGIGTSSEGFYVHCPCGEGFDLRPESLRRHKWEEEDG